MKSQREQKTAEGSFAEEFCGKLRVKVSVGGGCVVGVVGVE